MISCFGRPSLVQNFSICINFSPTNCLQPTPTTLLIRWENIKFRFGCDFELFEQFSIQQLRSIFTIICIDVYVLLREMPFVFPHFIMAAILHVKCDVGSGRENGNTKKINVRNQPSTVVLEICSIKTGKFTENRA